MPDPEQTILEGDAFDTLAEFDGESFHAIVTDPPYGIAFMADHNEWDSFDSPKAYQEWCEQWTIDALRVLKPGGHMIAFSGNRTFHRLACAVEDAGFEIRDTITWHYGTGFGAGKTQDATNWMDDEDDIEQWAGFKMGLKPATEFAVLARKAFDNATYENVLGHGTGALNVDGARIPAHGTTTEGRYPSNLCLDSVAAQLFDEQSGVVEGGIAPTLNKDVDDTSPEDLGSHNGYTRPNKSAYTHRNDDAIRSYGDSGGASRFFYTSKASPSERSINGQVENDHATVKPLDLMEHLVTLVTAPGQRVLDPFAGSGTTIMACRRLGREGIGIEQDAEHAELARERVELAHELETEFADPSKLDETGGETSDSPTLESFGDD